MRHALKAAAWAVLIGTASIAPAQLVGGHVGVGVGVGAGVNVPAVGATVDDAARATGDTVDRTARAAGDGVRDAGRDAPSVTVKAGASTRVDRGTRCYYQPDDYYYAPVYHDGYYYCEQRTGGASAGARVTTPR